MRRVGSAAFITAGNSMFRASALICRMCSCIRTSNTRSGPRPTQWSSAGMVWVYMGSRAKPPPLPAFEILDVPDDEVGVLLIQRHCNYLQALEGDIDTSHFGFLHAGHVDPDDLAEEEPIQHTVAIRAPEYHIADTAWGTTYAGHRSAGPGRISWRFGNFIFPFWTQVPNGEIGRHVQIRGWVPLDDEHTMYCVLWWKRGVSAMTQQAPTFKDGT